MANLISNQTGVKSYNLGDIFGDNSSDTFGTKADTKMKDMNLNKILLNDCCIIEDVYYGWLSASSDKADIIILLKINVYIRDWRIIKRFLKRKFGIIQTNKRETLKRFIQLIK